MNEPIVNVPRQWKVSRVACVGLLGLSLVAVTRSAHAANVQVRYTVWTAAAVPESTPPAQPAHHGATSKVTVVAKNTTVEAAVNAIARQAHLQPIYKNSPMLKKRIDVNLTDVNVMEALANVLHGTGLVAKLASDGETIVIREALPSAHERSQQTTGTIVGRVTDSATRAGVAGATVSIQGSQLSTTTNDSGRFVLDHVPVGEQLLTVKLFGYRPASRTVTVAEHQRLSVFVTLSAVPTVLSGVVTTGAGIQPRLQVGNDITVINADSIQQVAPVTNITQMLETRVPGLTVTNTTGVPGAPARLRLRGSSSIERSDDPIVIVDGVRVYADQSGTYSNLSGVTTGGGSSVSGRVSPTGNSVFSGYAGPSPLDQIDPNSIETIEVMKGPSASALYGSDAANGVIVITTKHGKAGPTRWNVSLNAGRSSLSGDWPTNYFRFGHAIALNNGGSQICSAFDGPSLCALDSIVAFQALNDPKYSPLGTGTNGGISLTVSGGNGPLTYSVTGSADDQNGYLELPGIEVARFEKFHGFPAPDWMRHPDKYATWGGSSQLTAQLGHHGTTVSLSGAIYHSGQQQSSLQTALARLEGVYIDTSQLASNPLLTEYYERAQLRSLNFTNALTLNGWAPWSWLPVTATLGLNVLNTDNNAVTPRDYVLGTPDSLGQYATTRGSSISQTLNIGTTLMQRFVQTAVGINVLNSSQTTLTSSTIGLPVGVMMPNTFTCSGICTTQQRLSAATYGWYVQPTLHLASRLFVSPGFRLDGGTASGNNSNLSLFPKIDVSYVAINRPDDPMFGALTLLRPRIAFGVAGVQPQAGDKLRLFAPGTVDPIGGTGAPIDIVALESLGNTELHPERSREWEGGFDAEFWEQRLSLSLTSYHKTRYDAIIAIPVAPSVGVGTGDNTIQKNVGTIRNTGFEASASAQIFDQPSFGWNVNGNFSRNTNKVLGLVQGQKPILMSSGAGYQSIIAPGFPLNGIWARPILSYNDVNGDGIISPGEVRLGDTTVYLGARGPKYELSLATTLSFFNDRLSVNTSADYQNGVTQTNIGTAARLQINDPSTPMSQQAAIAALSSTAYGIVQTVNTLRWNTLSINYVVPPATAHWFHVSSMSVALQGSNLGLKTAYRGKDPDVNAFSTGNQTADTGQLPQPRMWRLRIALGN